MILLDTQALVWLGTNHRRAAPLNDSSEPLCVSPASLLELQLLTEAGRLRTRRGAAVAEDPRWVVDEPLAANWFQAAEELSWTRDIFDRLIVAHALTRGLRLATADSEILARLAPRQVMEL